MRLFDLGSSGWSTVWLADAADFAAWLEFCLGGSWRVEARALQGRGRFHVTHVLTGQSEDFDDALMRVDHPVAAIQGRFDAGSRWNAGHC